MKKAKVTALCSRLSLCHCQCSFAQQDSTRRPDVVRLAGGIIHNIGSPLRWKKTDWKRFSIVALSIATISTLDRPVNQYWSTKHDQSLNVINDIGYSYGKPYSGLAFAGGFYLTGILVKNEWVRETGLMLATSLITSSLLEATLKPLIGRARPPLGTGNYDFHPFSSGAEFHSLPSGHAAIAFTISFVLAKRIESVPLKILFYGFAVSSAFCRLYSNAHWLSDVALGGTIAWFSASESIKYISNTRFIRNNKTNITLHPNVGGMTLRIAFN